MKTKTVMASLTVAIGFAAIGTYATLTYAGVNAEGVPAKPTATAAVASDPESSARINVKALAANLEFLGEKPVLASHPLLIEFWATWCPPCRASIAHLNDLAKKYHANGLQIVGIADEDKAVVENFRDRTPMDYAVALDSNQTLAAAFGVQAIPQAWLLDKEGRVVWSGHPMELDDQIITGVLAVNPTK